MIRDFENDTPIDDAMTVLDLLCARWGDNTVRRIHLPRVREGRRFYVEPYLEIRHCRDFGDGDVHRIRVTERSARELREGRLVTGQPHWGHTDMHELSISDAGVRRIWDVRTSAGLPMEFRSEEWIQREPWGSMPKRRRTR